MWYVSGLLLTRNKSVFGACLCGTTVAAALPIVLIPEALLFPLQELVWLEDRSSMLDVLGAAAVLYTCLNGLRGGLHSN